MKTKEKTAQNMAKEAAIMTMIIMGALVNPEFSWSMTTLLIS
jgi:mannose/fructose/N-acetylgalactosamine-specific phosphotransferase system component IID